MNVVLVFFLLLFSKGVLAYDYPNVTIKFKDKPPSVVYYKEKLSLPMIIEHNNLKFHMAWTLPNGSQFERTPESGGCPPFPNANAAYAPRTCYINLVIPTDPSGTGTVGNIIQGGITYRVSGRQDVYEWDYTFSAPTGIYIKVIPHCPSMLTTPPQNATANQDVTINLKPFVKYYDENFIYRKSVPLEVSPAELDGLHFDPARVSIVGIPTRLGTYSFTINAKKDNNCTSQPTTLNIMVQANLKDKPAFKPAPIIVPAVPGQKYSMNLIELIEPRPGYMINNQVQFHISPNMPSPSWLKISATDATQLEGIVPDTSAGKTESITLIASTNTGGDSQPLTINIPIAYDPTKKPTLNEFTLNQRAGNEFYYDLTKHITNPGTQAIDLTIDKIEPQVDWQLSHDQTTLHGLIPPDATGEKIQLTLRASTPDGGPSEPVIIPLQVDIDKELTPYFKDSDLSLPMAVSGRPYFFDFAEYHAVYPDNIPYQVEWADEALHPHPSWIKLQNNQLIVDEVPDVDEFETPLFVIIKNIPGGTSKVKEIDLFVHSLKNTRTAS